MSTYRLWREQEDAMLREALDGILPFQTEIEVLSELQKAFPGRTVAALQARVRKLGISIRIKGSEINQQKFEEFLKLREPI